MAWPSVADQVSARAVLASYGSASGEPEVERVQLALLKLSNGSIDELARLTTVAKTDPRLP